ncbi:nucleotide sugar dehydrogenase, partial [Christiangramia aquimixticola]
MLTSIQDSKIAVIGLGYVGLPLAVEFAKKFPVIGFDIDKKRVGELLKGNDHTLEVEDDLLKSVLTSNSPKIGQIGLLPTCDPEQL